MVSAFLNERKTDFNEHFNTTIIMVLARYRDGQIVSGEFWTRISPTWYNRAFRGEYWNDLINTVHRIQRRALRETKRPFLMLDEWRTKMYVHEKRLVAMAFKREVKQQPKKEVDKRS